MKTASTEREAIVAKLTVTQRETLMAIHPNVVDGFRPNEGEPHNAYTALCALGLLRKWRLGDSPTYYAVEPLGLSIRDHLKDQDHGRA